MILIGQFDSPFVRRVGVALTLYGMAFEHRPWSVFGDAEAIAAYNPLRRVPTLVLGALLYVFATTAYGMLVSAFTKTQIAALFGTAIFTVLPATQFSGMLSPVSSLTGAAKYIGQGFPMSYFVPVSVGTFTKGLGFSDLWPDLLKLALFAPLLIGLSAVLLRKQER